MGRLKGISPIISPQLLCALASMGHGDEIVLADANFPTSSVCKQGPQEIRADGHTIPNLLRAILTLLPLDTYVECPVAMMDVVPEDKAKGLRAPDYRDIVNAAEGKQIRIQHLERYEFYDRAKKAFAVVHSGETALYGNVILKMGVIPGNA